MARDEIETEGRTRSRARPTMNGFNRSASIQRLATALGRRFGVWVASPSVALFSALVAGKARPKRLLVDPSAPRFVSNIARFAGALPVPVAASQVDQALRGALHTEGLSADLVWVTALHRDGRLAEAEWLAGARAHGVPSIEICLGSLSGLIGTGPRAASFTVVQLDAEGTLDGLQLTALLTDDEGLADRVTQLCLPHPGSTDYVLDASPRGLTHDEPALMGLLDGLIERAKLPAQQVRTTHPSAPAPEFDLSWNRRFQDESGPTPAVSVSTAVPVWSGEPGKNPWVARLSEVEARHAQAVQSLATVRNQLEEAQAGRSAVSDQLQLIEKRSEEERERFLSLQANVDREREEHRRSAGEAARALDEIRTEKTALAESVSSLRAELEAAKKGNATRDDDHRAEIAAQRTHFEKQEETLDEVRAELDRLKTELLDQTAATDKSSAQARARVAELETALAEADGAREKAVSEAREAREKLIADADAARDKLREQLALATADSKALSAKLEEAERERKELHTTSTQREADLSRSLEEQTQRVKDLEREAKTEEQRATAAEAARKKLADQLAHAEAELKTVTERAEKANRDRDELRAESVRRETELSKSLELQSKRVNELEQEAKADHDRAIAAEAAKSTLAAQIARMESDAAAKDHSGIALLDQKGATERELVLARAEAASLKARLDELVAQQSEARAEASKRESRLESALEEQKQREVRLGTDAAAFHERAAEWEISRAQLTARVAQLENELTRHALSLNEAADRSKAAEIELKSLSTTNTDLIRQLANTDAARRAHEEKLKEMEASAETRLAEARSSAELSAAQSVESWKSRLDAAEEVTRALKTALAARASEAVAYEKAAAAGDSHRKSLEERIAQLKKGLANSDADRDPKSLAPEPVITEPSVDVDEPLETVRASFREKAAWEVQRPRFAPSEEADIDFGDSSLTLGGPIDYSAPPSMPSLGEGAPRSEFAPEYDAATRLQSGPEKSARGWLRNVTKRMRRS